MILEFLNENKARKLKKHYNVLFTNRICIS